MFLEQPVEKLPGTSIVTIKKLKSLDLLTFDQLINYFPSRHEDFSIVSPIASLQDGEKVTISGTITAAKNDYVRRRLTIQRVSIADDTGSISATWYNQPFLIRMFMPQLNLNISGEVKFKGRLNILPKEYEVLKNPGQPTIHTSRIVPIYPEKRGLSSRTLREKIYYVLGQLDEKILPELLPVGFLKKHQLIDTATAYKNYHFPASSQLLKQSKRRLAFDELFIIQLSARLVREHWEREKVGNVLEVEKNRDRINEFIKKLPFTLTNGQKKVIKEIEEDLGKTHPMNRFLQGDVGSGKTVVAAVGAYISYLNGFQTLFMAPTEILAQQHFKTLSMLFANTSVEIGLQTSSSKDKKNADIIVGTQALITKSQSFKRAGFVVIDEQHRFGVRQRAILKEKGLNPHLLSMTATPIPRTVALTLYGELDFSVLDEMPKGRVPVKTFLVPNVKRADGYQWIQKKINEDKSQVFIICPLIEESEVETVKTAKAATKEYEHLKKNVFPKLKVGLIHGKLKSKEKDAAMDAFKKHEYDILVATSVVEVGIDVPNATIMLIEGAERYGLAQLHQLRGRVGRGSKQSYCFVFTESNTPQVLDRLSYFAQNNHGQKLAEYDLARRGPGDLYGIRQHGHDSLMVASFSDYLLIEETKKAVEEFRKSYSLKDYQSLKKRVDAFQVHQIAKD